MALYNATAFLTHSLKTMITGGEFKSLHLRQIGNPGIRCEYRVFCCLWGKISMGEYQNVGFRCLRFLWFSLCVSLMGFICLLPG